MILIIILIGLIVGSFIGAYSYRYPREISIAKGRSFCPRCKIKIEWFDNLPVLSFLFLKGKCRSCKNKISIRYPIIELLTAVTLTIVWLGRQTIIENLNLNYSFTFINFVFIAIVTLILIGVFLVDWEEQIIPDELVFVGLATAFFYFVTLNPNVLYVHLLTGALAAMFLLTLHLITLGRGMGLGDVKLALMVGVVLGPMLTITWLFLAFIIGAIIGIMLVALKLSRLKDKIAFGPFLVVSFFIVLLLGTTISRFIIPFPL